MVMSLTAANGAFSSKSGIDILTLSGEKAHRWPQLDPEDNFLIQATANSRVMFNRDRVMALHSVINLFCTCTSLMNRSTRSESELDLIICFHGKRFVCYDLKKLDSKFLLLF